MPSPEIIVFDIETIPDAASARRLLGQPELSDIEARDALSAYFLEKTGGKNDFPRQPYHQVVALGYAQLTREPGEDGGIELIVRRIGCAGTAASDECELIEAFFRRIEQRAPQLVSFNGRGFDLPVLKYRAMVHQLSCPRWFSEGNRFEGYEARYSDSYHHDLLETLSDYGASARCSLHEVAAAFSLPGKLETEGSMVRALFERGEIEAIRNYCELDVITTTLVFLRRQLFCGALTSGGFARAMAGIRNYLIVESETRPHLKLYLEAWKE